MKMPLPSPPPSDGHDDSKDKAKPAAVDPLHAQQQYFRREERDAIARGIEEFFLTRDRLRERFFANIVGQPHHGHWLSFWPFLQQARRMYGLCAKGLVVFGGWFREAPEDLSEATPPPEELLKLLRRYAVYHRTLEHLAFSLDCKGREQAEIERRVLVFAKWVDDHAAWFGSAVRSGRWQLTDVEPHCHTEMKHLLTLIKGALQRLEHRAFLFFPDDDPASGWRDFFAFADLYARLPAEFINSFGGYYLVIQLPSA